MSMQRNMAEWVWRGWEKFFRKTQSFSKRLFGVSLLTIFFLILAALWSRTPLRPFPSLTFTAAALTAVYGGFGLGLVSTLLLGIAVDYFWVTPGHIGLGAQDYLIKTLVAALVGALVSTLRMAFLRSERAKQEAERAKQEAERAKQEAERAKQEAERAKQEAEAAVRARDEIVGVISHELKNPLTALQTGVSLIERVFPKAPENEKALRLIERLKPSIKRMGLLVSDLLDVTRLEARALKLEPTNSKLRELVVEVIRSYEPAALEKMVELGVAEIPPDADSVFCDTARTGQVLSNIVGNAVKFTNEGGSIRVSARRENDHIEVRVTDTGKGISKEHLPHVFDRFWQAKDTAYKGTGLGLSIAKGLVEAQGGRIWVESREGEGTTFYFTLPVAVFVKERTQKTA